MTAGLPPLQGVDLLAAIPIVLTAAAARWGLLAMARRGLWLRALPVLHRLMLAFLATLVLAAFVLFATGRGASIWYGLGAAGLCGLGLLWRRGPSLWRARSEAEERRIAARDF